MRRMGTCTSNEPDQFFSIDDIYELPIDKFSHDCQNYRSQSTELCSSRCCSEKPRGLINESQSRRSSKSTEAASNECSSDLPQSGNCDSIPEWQIDIAHKMFEKANRFAAKGDNHEAIVMYKQMFILLQKQTEDQNETDDEEWHNFLIFLEIYSQQLNDFLQKAIELYSIISEEMQSSKKYRNRVKQIHAEMSQDLFEYCNAAEMIERALYNLGICYKNIDNLVCSEAVIAECKKFREIIYGKNSMKVAEVLHCRSTILQRAGQVEEAQVAKRESIKVQRRLQDQRSSRKVKECLRDYCKVYKEMA